MKLKHMTCSIIVLMVFGTVYLLDFKFVSNKHFLEKRNIELEMDEIQVLKSDYPFEIKRNQILYLRSKAVCDISHFIDSKTNGIEYKKCTNLEAEEFSADDLVDYQMKLYELK